MSKNVCSNPSHSDREGSMYCAKCEKFYCTECEMGIHNVFFSDHSNFVTHNVGEENIFTGKCEEHKDYPLDFFCKKHKKLCCAKCKDKDGRHGKCKAVPFDSLESEKIREDFTDAINALEMEINKAENFSGEEPERKISEMEQKVVQIKETITESFKRLHKAIEERENELLSEIENVYDHEELDKAISEFREVSGAKEVLDQGKRVLENQSQPKEMLYRTNNITKTKDKIEALGSKIVDILCEIETLDFTSSCDTLVQEIKSFGEVKYSKEKFEPGVVVVSVTSNSINAVCKRSPLNETSYEVLIYNDTTGKTEIAYTGEETNFTVENLTPNTNYCLLTRVGTEGIFGKFSKGIFVETEKEPERVTNEENISYWEEPDENSINENLIDTEELTRGHENVTNCEGMNPPELFKRSQWKRCPRYVKKVRLYSVNEFDPNIAKNVSHDENSCTIIGNTSLPPNKVTSWNIKINNSRNNNGDGIWVGVAPFDINQDCDRNHSNCGWYVNCYTLKLQSGLPHNYRRVEYGVRKKNGKYVHTGDNVGVVMDTINGTVSFVLDGVNQGLGFEGIPLDKPLVPCVLMNYKGDSVELDTSEVEELYVDGSVPVPQKLRIANKTWDSLTISWNAVPRVNSYNIEVDGIIHYVDSKARSFTKDGLLQESEHNIRIRAARAEGISKWSNYIRGRTLEMSPFPECGWKKCPTYVDKAIKYAINEGNTKIAMKPTEDKAKSLCTIIGSAVIPMNSMVSWSVNIVVSNENDGDEIYVGVAPFDIDQDNGNNIEDCGWYFGCYLSQLYTGLPCTCKRRRYGQRKEIGEYVHTGSKIGVVVDTTEGDISFVVDGLDFGIAFEGIPLDKPLVPCVLLGKERDLIELDLSDVMLMMNDTIPIPKWKHAETINWDSIKLTWSPVEGATLYQIMIDESGYIDCISTNNFIKRNLLPNKEYSFSIRAIRGTEIGNWSSFITGRTSELDLRYKYPWKSCQENIDRGMKYLISAMNPQIATKLSGSDYSTIIGSTPLPLNKRISWDIKILKSKENNGAGILIGIAPSDIKQNDPDNWKKCGWYYACYSSTLWSGPPQRLSGTTYWICGRAGECTHEGDVITTVINTTTGENSFIVNNVNYGLAYKRIPLDKPLVPCVLLCWEGDSVELLI